MKSSLRAIPFVKATACGNDFLLIDHSAAPDGISVRDFTKQVCDRHQGVGADGVEWMLPHSSADLEIRLINADGSEAEISGNGTRCVAAYLCAKRGREKITIQTGAGLKVCALTARREAEYEFEIEMGNAIVDPELALQTKTGEVRGIPVSMGNPHYVVFVTEFAKDWQAFASEIQGNPHFIHGVNVELALVDGSHDLSARFFERGAGETQSSGTGSCATASAALATGRAESPVKVHAVGGTQTVRLQNGNLILRGSAHLVCSGEFFLN